MSHSSIRPLLPHVLIVAALAIGGRLIIVDPMARELRQVEQTIAEARSAPVETAGAAVEDMAARLVSIRSRVCEVTARSEAGRDSARLYRTIVDEAERNGVTVRSLSPVTTAPIAAAPGGGAPTAGNSCAAARVELSADGPFESIAALLQALQNSEAHVRLVTLSLARQSNPGASGVAAKIVFETLSFPVPDALAALKGGNDASR